MAKKLNRFLIITIVLMCSIITLFAATNNLITSAEDEYEEEGVIRIAHITDMHYYPLRYCYNGTDPEADFLVDMRAESRLLIENSAIFIKVLEGIREKGQDLDYLVLSGDLAKDGERASHIDIANALRKLQNDIRADGNPDFQVLVIFGNHDIYNDATYEYSGDGMRKPAPNVTRKELSKIYSGLGYPDMDEADALEFYTDEELNLTLVPYDKDDDAYIHSNNAANLDIEWLYARKENYNSLKDYGHGELSYYVTSDKGASFMMIDEEDSNAEDGHLLSATFTANIFDFFADCADSDDNYTKIIVLHHNIVPQHPLEDTMMAGFTVEDWVTVADFFADLGVRYSFSGHMHANSISHHISFNNNQITDIETGSSSSYAGGVRYSDISYGYIGDTYAEKLTTMLELTKEVDFGYIIDNEYLDDEFFTENRVDHLIEGKKCTDISEYAKIRIYENAIDNYMVKYLSPEIVPELLSMVKGYIPDKVMGLPLGSIKNSIDIIVDNLISEIETKVLDDYTYGGDNPICANGENKLFGFLEELVGEVRGLSITSRDDSIIEVFFFCFFAHIDGALYTSIDQLPSHIREGIDNLRNGSVVESLLEILLDKDKGVYKILAGLLTREMNLSEGLSANDMNLLNSLGGVLGIENFNVASVNLDKLVRAALSFLDIGLDIGTGTALDFVDTMLNSYLTKSFSTGLGQIAANALLAFAIDESPNVSYDDPIPITLSAGDEFTFIDIAREDNPTVANGKLPSMITVSFGEDSRTDKNFVWFTDKRVNATEIRYSEKEDMTGAVTVSGEFAVYAHTYAQIDVGVFATYGTGEIGRHSVELKNLKPGTEYYYQVGASGFGMGGYWSPVYSTATAPDDNKEFDILLFADPQGYTQSSYDEVFEVLNNIESVFINGYDFVISMGDNVDNSKNMAHYRYLLNTCPEFFANTTFVTATGNHESSSFVVDDSFNPSSADVVITPYNNSLLYYNVSAPEQNAATGLYYSFDYSGVHFTVLNTNDLENNKLSAAQVRWLEEDLANTDKAHKVVIMHKSLYSSGSHSFDIDVIEMRKQLTPIFYNNGVHLVLGGHDHTYSTTYYLDGEGEIARKGAYKSKIGDKGILFVTLGTIGDKFYNWQDNPDIPVRYGEELHAPTLSRPVFGRLYYDGEELYYEAYEYDLETGEINELKPKNNIIAIIAVVAGSSAVLSGGIAITVIHLKKKRAA